MPETRQGFAFSNPNYCNDNGWGALITPDELRYIYSFGNELVAPNCQTITDESLWWYINNAIANIERDLNVALKKRYYRYRPIQGQTRTDFTGSEATANGCADLRRAIDLSVNYNIKVAIDSDAYVTVNCQGISPATTRLDEIVTNINIALGGTYAYERDGKYLQIKSTTKGEDSYVEFEAPSGKDATGVIMGFNIDDGYHHVYRGWREDIDFFWEEPYDFDSTQLSSYMYLKLNRRPIISVDSIEFRDPTGNVITDIEDWMRINYRKGSIEFFPNEGSLASLPLLIGNSAFFTRALAGRYRYPDAFFVDFTAGFETAEHLMKVWPELTSVVGMLSAINLLNDYGDGRSPGLASSSISLAGISESFATTQSATNALFGARILNFEKQLKKFYQKNGNKYSGLLIGRL